MNVWEICILIMVSAISIMSVIAAVYRSIVNTVERYQVRKLNRDLQTFTKIMEELPKMMVTTFEMINKKIEEDEKKRVEKIKKTFEQNYTTDPDIFMDPDVEHCG